MKLKDHQIGLHTDLQLFRSFKFSRDYIRDLKGEIPRASKGSPINYGSRRVKNPSYTRIQEVTMINGTEIKIFENAVFLENVKIGTAPESWSKSKKNQFCKSIVWQFLNDPGSLHEKLIEIRSSLPVPVAIIQYDRPGIPIQPVNRYGYLRISLYEESMPAGGCPA